MMRIEEWNRVYAGIRAQKGKGREVGKLLTERAQ